MSYHYLLDVAIILASTKVLGLFTKRLHLPQVVGALLAGLIFGPAVLNVLHGTEFLSQLSELGVIVIMFEAGLETNLAELKKTGKAGFFIALCGVIVPLLGGTAFGFFFSPDHTHPHALLQNVFIGVVLTATSVSITVETLKEMGRLNTKVGNTILAAALMDDILGLVCLTIVASLGGDTSSGGVGFVLVKIALFFVLALLIGVLVHKVLIWYSERTGNHNSRRFTIIAFVLCLLMAYIAEHFFGVADIIGAFVAGVVIGTTKQATYIDSRFQPISYMLLTPIFFASIGINLELPALNLQLLLASVALVSIAVLTKLVGCGLGAKVCGMSNRESLQIGLGMVCRGEVALIVANKGRSLGLVPAEFFGPIVIMVVCAAVLTPVLLKLAFRGVHQYEGMEESALVDRMEVLDQLDAVGQQLLDMDSAMQRESKKDK